MKKALLLVSILSISVFSTACINNFAVQELNNKAKTSIEQGDYQSAIERLKSSIDLDDSIFESHYNLAVAYTQAEDYVNAIASYKKAIELKPDFADAYYSIAVAQESLATAIDAGEVEVTDDGQFAKAASIDTESDNAEEGITVENKLPEAALNAKKGLLNDASSNYNKYLELAPNAEDADAVNTKIKALEEKISNPAETVAADTPAPLLEVQ